MTTETGLVEQGIAAARAKDYARARHQLVQAVKCDPRNEQAWLWLSKVLPTLEQSLWCVEHLLTINPNHIQAREARDVLQIRLILEEGGMRATPAEPVSTPTRRYLLGEALVEAGVLTTEQLAAALQVQVQQALLQAPLSLGEILLRMRLVARDDLDAALAAQVESSLNHAPSSGLGRLGEYLVRRRLLTTAQLHHALARQARSHGAGRSERLGEIVVALGYVTASALNQAILAWQEEFDHAFV